MLPKHGVTYSVFLLAVAAQLSPRRNLVDWTDAARATSSFMAAAVDLLGPARGLTKLGLATVTDRVILAPQLLAIGQVANRTTMIRIAEFLLVAAPPTWLRLAVNQDGVAREYIPSQDLDALSWLEPELDQLLLRVYSQIGGEQKDEFREWLGRAAELFLLAAFEDAGLRPVHVASISDAYGYDIEIPGEPAVRVEVKAASERTSGSFMLTRNEYEKSCAYGAQWCLIQVVFKSAAFVAKRIDHSHIQIVTRLAPGAITAVVPPDPPGFTWLESAKLRPPDSMWALANIDLDPKFAMPGFEKGAT